MRTDQDRLCDIQQAIERIDKYVAQGRDAFEQSELIQNWIVHHLQIIGEAASKLSDATRKSAPGIPWSGIIGMRNILVHDYFGIDTDIVWTAAHDHLPAMKKQIDKLMAQLP